MFKTITANKDLKRRLIITIIVLIISQFVTNIPAPGINKELISGFLTSDIGQSMGFLTLFSGNSLQNLSMFVLGVSPFITASIILQLLRVAFPKLDELAKDGKRGEAKFKMISYATGAFFGIIQSLPIAYGFKKSGLLIENNNKYFALVAISLIIGSLAFILFSAIIEKFGLKNGMSLILMTNIISRIPNDLTAIFEMYVKNKPILVGILAIVVTVVIVSALCVCVIFLQDGEKRVTVQYSSHVSKFNGATNKTYIPIKVNVAGVMPIIFTMNIFQLYSLVVGIVGANENSVFKHIQKALTTSNWFNKAYPWCTLGLLFYIFLLVAFQYFYSIIQFDTEKIAQNLKNQGGVITGVRPGKPTEEYLTKKLNSMTLVGSICLFVVAVVPIIIAGLFNMHSLSLGGTSIIIIVGVLIETAKMIESECLQTNQTSSFLW